MSLKLLIVADKILNKTDYGRSRAAGTGMTVPLRNRKRFKETLHNSVKNLHLVVRSKEIDKCVYEHMLLTSNQLFSILELRMSTSFASLFSVTKLHMLIYICASTKITKYLRQ